MKDSRKAWEYTKEVVFERLDHKMREDKLYLDYSMTLPKLRAICEKYKSFRGYINSLRVEHLLADVQESRTAEPEGGDPDEFANSYGFRTRRSLDRILVKETGCTYRKILRRRNRSK